MHKVFVYGTLKSGFPNFQVNHGNRIPGTFSTLNSYPLYLVGSRYVPWLVLDEGQGYPVRGELYQVDDQTLSDMDELEQTASADGYQRVEIPIVNVDINQTLSAYVYAKPRALTLNADIRQTLNDEYLLTHARRYQNRIEASR